MRDVSPEDRFEYMLRYGNIDADADVCDAMFTSTDAEPGSSEKIEVMRRRFELGQPIFHPKDRCNYDGMGLLDRLAGE